MMDNDVLRITDIPTQKRGSPKITHQKALDKEMTSVIYKIHYLNLEFMLVNTKILKKYLHYDKKVHGILF